MSIEQEAVVRARLDGVEDVTGGARKIGSAWSEAGASITSAFKGAAGAVSGAVAGVVSDLGHVVTAAAAINFAGALQGVHQLEDSAARMGVGANRSVRSVQDGINELSVKLGEMPQATADWVSAVSRLTYGYEGAAAAAQGAKEYAAFTGQNLQDVQGLTVGIEQLTGSVGKSGRALAVLVQQANDLGTVGGVRALGDMVEHLQGQLSQLENGHLNKDTSLLAGLGNTAGKGFNPQQRERATGALLSRIESNPEGFERFLGHKITDEFGHVKDMTGTLEELSTYAKRGKGQQFRSEQTFGREATALLTHTDFAAIQRAEYARPSGAPADALARLKGTPEGKYKADEVQKSLTMQEHLDDDSFLGGLERSIHHLSSKYPVLTAVGTSVGTTLLGQKMLPALKSLGSVFGSGGGAGGGAAAAAGEGAGASVMTGLGAAGAGAVGVMGASVLGTLEVLGELSAASHDKQGFISKDLGYKEAEHLSSKAAQAEAEAASHRSPGMQAALEAERERLKARHAGGGAAAVVAAGGTIDFHNFFEAVSKFETAVKTMTTDQKPVKISLTDDTSNRVHHHIRWHQ